MYFNPVADAWWEKKPRMSILQAFEPRKGAGLEHTYFAAHVPRLEEVEDHWEKVPLSFDHLCIVG